MKTIQLSFAALALGLAGGCREEAVNVPTEPLQPGEPIIEAPLDRSTLDEEEPAAVDPDEDEPAAAVRMPILSVDPGADDPEPVTHAVAVLRSLPGTAAAIHGTVRFEVRSDGQLAVSAAVEGLPGDRHAYHVHQIGDCTGEDGKRAGPHFNFLGSSESPPDDIDRITGNLGELVPDAPGGTATHTAAVPHANLVGPFSIIGRAVIIHAKGNDPTKPPDGAAGARLACGVIGIATEDTQAAAAPEVPPAPGPR